MILSGAEKLSLLEVDAVLLGHPEVVDAACIGVAHERFGEVPAAFIVMRAGHTETTARDFLDAYCTTTMERWKRPRLYVFLDSIPRTAAKRTKMTGEMRRMIAGLTVANADGVVTLSQLKARSAATDERKSEG
jgi:acyl-coenzyme A synthetase/AMP-(fatty) acid ligase